MKTFKAVVLVAVMAILAACTTVHYGKAPDGTVTMDYSKFGTTANITAEIASDGGKVAVSNQNMVDFSSLMQMFKAASVAK